MGRGSHAFYSQSAMRAPRASSISALSSPTCFKSWARPILVSLKKREWGLALGRRRREQEPRTPCGRESVSSGE